jgi:hypothetical protein
MILPERPYRGHWEFQIKNKNKSVTGMLRYRTERPDGEMLMPESVVSMPIPSYGSSRVWDEI